MKNSIKIASLALAVAVSFAACKGSTSSSTTDSTKTVDSTSTTTVDTTKKDTSKMNMSADTTKKDTTKKK